MPLIFVPVVVVTPVVVDQYRLYEVAPLTAGQEMVTCLVPPVAVTPVGTAGIVAADVLGLVLADTSAEAAPLRPALTALTMKKYVVFTASGFNTNGLVTFLTRIASTWSL
jgi:hypothetical protein